MISGQHTVKALLELRRQYIEEEKPLPSWLVHVNAKILKPETPVHWRQMYAGDEQFRQGRAKQLQLSDLAAHLLGTDEVKKERDSVIRLAMALRKCGFDRAETEVCDPTSPGCLPVGWLHEGATVRVSTWFFPPRPFTFPCRTPSRSSTVPCSSGWSGWVRQRWTACGTWRRTTR